MSGFENPIVDGNNGLLIPFIKSPNYVSGSTGWAIFKNGDAELNGAIFRGNIVIDEASQGILVYDGSPALGNLIFAVSNAEEIDLIGNGFTTGITLPAESGSSQSGRIQWKKPGGLNANLIIGEIQAFTDNVDPRIEIWARNQSRLLFQYEDTSPGLQFGAGPTGRYYAETEFYSALSIASGGALKTLTTVEAITVHGNDYPSGVGFDTGATGTWTCPESGLYAASLVVPFQAWVAGSIIRLAITDTNTGKFTSNEYECLTGRGVLSTEIDCTQGHVFVGQVFQNTGAAQTIFNSLGATAQEARWTMRRYL